MKFTDKYSDEALDVIRGPYHGPNGKKWEIAVSPNPGARIPEYRWVASCYNSVWKPWPKFRIWGKTREEAYKKATDKIRSGRLEQEPFLTDEEIALAMIRERAIELAKAKQKAADGIVCELPDLQPDPPSTKEPD